MEHVVHHGLQEGPVVADEEHGRVEPAEIVLQPAGGLEIEMVRGLVEEEHVGRRHELLRQAEAAALAAAQPGERAGPGLVGIEAQAVEDGVDPGGEGVAALAVEPVEIAVVRGQHLRRAAVARFGQRGRLRRERVLQRQQVGERAGGGLPDRRGAGELAVLLHDRVSQAARAGHRPGARLGLAR